MSTKQNSDVTLELRKREGNDFLKESHCRTGTDTAVGRGAQAPPTHTGAVEPLWCPHEFLGKVL